MHFRPGFYEPSLTPREGASQKIDRIDPVDRHRPLVIRMKVRNAVWTTGFGEHPNDDSEEAAQFGHRPTLLHEFGDGAGPKRGARATRG